MRIRQLFNNQCGSNYLSQLFQLLFYIAVTLASICHSAAAIDQSTFSTPRTTVSLISNQDTIQAGETFWLGFQFNLKPGWHIYYHNPGDSGLAAKASFDPITQFSIHDITWPTPKRIPFGPLVNYGYDGQVLLPLKIAAVPDIGRGIHSITAHLSWLVCEEDCIPEKATLTIPLSVSDSQSIPSSDLDLFNKQLGKLPENSPIDQDFIISQSENSLILSIPGELGTVTDSYFFPFQKGIVRPSAPQKLVFNEKGGIELIFERANSFKGFSKPIEGILTFLDHQKNSRAIRLEAQVKGGSDVVDSSNTPSLSRNKLDVGNFFIVLLLALVGGIILNLMPCVLPVLSIKVLSLVSQAKDSRSHQLLLGFSYTFGIVSSLTAIGAVLLLLRDQGAKIGWGFQLQYAPVVGLLALFFFVLGLSFLGFIEFGSQLASRAAALDKKEGVSGAFLSGLLATIVATPCTAPFLGTVIGVALIRPWYQSLLIFAVMGVGIALPYLTLVIIPSARRILPRPGKWMNTFKELLAFPLFATSIWLLWILSIQRGGQGVLLVLLAALVTAFGLWVLRTSYARMQIQRYIFRLVGLVIILAGILTIPLPDLLTLSRSEQVNADGSVSDVHGLRWLPYSESLINDLRRQKQSIYLDFTAAWCITCQVNKSVVFSDQRIIDFVKMKNIALVRADWTNQDPAISQALDRFGRGSVPFNVIYHPNEESPVELPTILTPALVLELLQGE